MSSIALSDELYERASEEAAAQGKTVEQFVSEALTSYLALRQLDRLAAYGRKRADELVLAESDVPQLIDEVRRQTSAAAADSPPVLRTLRGAARGVSADAHRRHLERKHR